MTFPNTTFTTGTTITSDWLNAVNDRCLETVNVKDFGAVGDGVTDDTAAFQLAASQGGMIFVPQATYKIVGEVIFGSNTTLAVANGTIFTMDCSGENGRGFYFKEAVNSGIVGEFIINASATSAGSDGSKNSCIQFGNDSGDASPAITQFGFVKGNVTIQITGAVNVKGVYLSGWVEDTTIENVSVTGVTNYAITSHWTKDTSSGIPTKTWHAHNIIIRDCKVYQKSGYSKPTRGYTFSAAGRVLVENCFADTTTLSFNPFVGDYGYTYAQNITNDQAYDFTFRDCVHAGGEGAFSADCISDGVDSSPVWDGTNYNTSVLVDGFEVDANDSTAGLMIALTGNNKVTFKNVNLYSDNVSQTREFFYTQLCNNVYVNGNFKHHRYMRLRTTTYATVDGCNISKPAPTPDATSYVITVEGVSFADITNNVLKDARVGIYSLDNFDKAIRIENNTFEDIGAACVDIAYTTQTHILNNTFKNVGTTTTSTNIYGIQFGTDVDGAIIANNTFSTNSYRYLISTDSTSSNSTIFGNLFLDLNTSATNSAAVFLNGSATNVLIDTNTNIVASGIDLVYP